MSGAGLTLRSKRRRYPSFTPYSLSAANFGPLGAWFRVADAISDVNGVSAIPDALNASSAVQSVNARKPSLGVSSNGLPVLNFAAGNVLTLPIAAFNNNQAAYGVGFWLKATSVALQTVFSVRLASGGANHDQIRFGFESAGSLFTTAYVSDGNGRKGVTNGSGYSAGVWRFITLEYYGAAGSESQRLSLYLDANPTRATLTFASEGAGGTLGALPAATGNILIGSEIDGSLNPFVGQIGPHIYIFTARAAGTSNGLLFSRAGLMAHEAPT
jgi:hypothetical protein